MGKKGPYKYCIVPCCTSSTVKTPEKIFFNVPRDPMKRKAWTNAMKRDEKFNKELSPVSTLWCCEDHFLLEKDMKNYMRYKLQGGKVFIKEDVIPHIFKCQASVTATSKKRKAQKRKLLDIAAAGLMDSQPTAPTSAAANLDVRSHATDVPVTVKKEICDESIQAVAKLMVHV
ncbi:unnamed protein product [Larinioides sclopetarius]|uniref:THAP-type domain-containing protein n=1 Tax=Larinioides sclopetarius TaxID=280406 RepID=A0AAV1Z1L8_9ARAC